MESLIFTCLINLIEHTSTVVDNFARFSPWLEYYGPLRYQFMVSWVVPRIKRVIYAVVAVNERERCGQRSA